LIYFLGPLDGIRILDLSHTLSGPMAAMILGDYGGEIIKIENPKLGDETRSWGPPFLEGKDEKESAYFLCLNRNKKSVTVNIKDPRGQEILHDLAAKSDVFIANFPSGKLEKYRLDWNFLKAINEKLVYVNISGYGQEGPYSKRPAYDLIMEGESGLTDLISRLANSKTPLTAGLPVSDIFTALYAHGAAMAGIIQRNRTGKGVYLETSLFESQLSALTNYASNVLINKKNGKMQTIDDSSHHPTLTPYQPFPAKDDVYFNIAALNNGQFERLCQVLGHPEWSQDSRFDNNHSRTANRSTLINFITEETRKKSVDYWIKELNNVGVPCGKINTIEEALKHPQIEPCRMIQTLNHSKLGSIEFVGPAVKIENYENEAAAPPSLGQDTKAILKEFLNKTEAEIQALYDEKVI
jgi:succinate---hydroxymethylglutarate CoA-transferase